MRATLLIWGLSTLAACSEQAGPLPAVADAALILAADAALQPVADAPVLVVPDAPPPPVDAAPPPPVDAAPPPPPDAGVPDAPVLVSSSTVVFRGELYQLDVGSIYDGVFNGVDGRHITAYASCPDAPDCDFLRVHIPHDVAPGSVLATRNDKTVEVIYDVDRFGPVAPFISREDSAVVNVVENDADHVELEVSGWLEFQGTIGGWASIDASMDIFGD